VLYTFKGGKDGAHPLGSLIFDKAGDLYSTAVEGGVYGNGVVFELIPNADGGWTERVLHTFTGGEDGGLPSAGLIFDTGDNLYGTTAVGGNLSDCSTGCGVVFRLTPYVHGSWTQKVLHKFTGQDGEYPSAALIFDKSGNLYGPTVFSGNLTGCDASYGCGVIFKLTPNAEGNWKESVLHRFKDNGPAFPKGSLIFDTLGNIYGTTPGCSGTHCTGVVFEITP